MLRQLQERSAKPYISFHILLIERETKNTEPIKYDPETKKLIEQANGTYNLCLERKCFDIKDREYLKKKCPSNCLNGSVHFC